MFPGPQRRPHQRGNRLRRLGNQGRSKNLLRKHKNFDPIRNTQSVKKPLGTLGHKDGVNGQARPHSFGNQVGSLNTGDTAIR